MRLMVSGNWRTVPITNPRDIPAVKEPKKWRFSALLGPQHLFVALMEHPGSRTSISPT